MPAPDLSETTRIRRLTPRHRRVDDDLVAFGGFFGWAFSTELSSASVTTEPIVVDSKRQDVSHFEAACSAGSCSGGRSCGARPAADEARGYARPLRPGGAAKAPCRPDRKTGAAAGERRDCRR
ncbi:hypothetical protein F2981_22415 (plasmid) [Sinorhizobium meliloti]|nr:hypothetical protein [Sinorhizobium meliloti]